MLKKRANYLRPQHIDSDDTFTGAVKPGLWAQDTQMMAQLHRIKGNSTIKARK